MGVGEVLVAAEVGNEANEICEGCETGPRVFAEGVKVPLVEDIESESARRRERGALNGCWTRKVEEEETGWFNDPDMLDVNLTELIDKNCRRKLRGGGVVICYHARRIDWLEAG